MDCIDNKISKKALEGFKETKKSILSNLNFDCLNKDSYCGEMKCDTCSFISLQDIHEYARGDSRKSVIVRTIKMPLVANRIGSFVICNPQTLCLLASFACSTVLSLPHHVFDYVYVCGHSAVALEDYTSQPEHISDIEFDVHSLSLFLKDLYAILLDLQKIGYCHGFHSADSIIFVGGKVRICYYGKCSFSYEGKRYLSTSDYLCGSVPDKLGLGNRHRVYTPLSLTYDYCNLYKSIIEYDNVSSVVRSNKRLNSLNNLLTSENLELIDSVLPKRIKNISP